MVDRIGPAGSGAVAPAGSPPAPGRAGPAAGGSFAQALQQQLQQQGLQFSGHAQERLRQRSIHLTQDDVARLEDAVSKAQAKGARESLVLMDDLAFIVSVQNRTVITAVDEATRKENVFTNIDSVVITQRAGTPLPA
ncbi:MAG TPA: TIGR02530 family flagellar biosynthesis protein [Dehalococcoidia bacterium]